MLVCSKEPLDAHTLRLYSGSQGWALRQYRDSMSHTGGSSPVGLSGSGAWIGRTRVGLIPQWTELMNLQAVDGICAMGGVVTFHEVLNRVMHRRAEQT